MSKRPRVAGKRYGIFASPRLSSGVCLAFRMPRASGPFENHATAAK